MDRNYPIVRLQRSPQKQERIKGRKPHFPKKIPYATQVKRLGEKFDKAASGLESFEKGIDVAIDPRAVVPERALVFELIGPVAEFDVAAQALGLEWLCSEDTEGEDEEPEEVDDDVAPASMLYLTMPSLQGLKRLLALWKRYKDKEDAPAEYRPLWRLFDYLRDVRVWSAKDRVDPSITRYVNAILAAAPDKPVLVEVHLWYRSEKERRDQAVHTLQDMLERVGGTMLDLVEVREIRYQGALVRVPAAVARRLAEGEPDQEPLASLDDVMTIRPQSAYFSHQDPSTPELGDIAAATATTKPCIAALLDGYPVENHAALAGRIVVQEVDVRATDVPAAARNHGTAMASLVLHGDLHAPGAPLSRKIVVVPVLTSTPDNAETTPANKLPIGVVYRALKAIVQADPNKRPDLANIVVVNHSICDTNAPFVRRPSPWAALLDYFSHEHRLLFIVSAGNIFDEFPVEAFANLADLQSADPAVREAAFLNAIEKAKATRSLLSPAESVNALTVGAVHADGATTASTAALDPYPTLEMTSLASALGHGVNRSVKPDLIEQGGRFSAGCANVAKGGVNAHARLSADMGHLVAAPSSTGDLRQVRRTSGTSNAAALITRASVELADALDHAFTDEKVNWHQLKTRVPILKALLTHGCSWGQIGRVLEKAYPPQGSHKWSQRRGTIAKFLGYGRPDFARVASGTTNRITLLAEDHILSGELHEYRIPLPSAMVNTRDVRSITVTLAWTTPILPTSADYRSIGLKIVDSNGTRHYWKGVTRGEVLQPNSEAGERGTLTHLILSGKNLCKEATKNGMFLGIQAYARHPSVEQAPVPYAVAVTLEIAQSLKTNVNVYAEVRDAIRTRTRVATRVGGRT